VKDPLLSLAPSDLRALAAAVATGRLSAPYVTTSVQRVLNASVAVEVASSLYQLAESNTPPLTLARTLELLADSLNARPPLEDLIDFVITGPDGTGAGGRSTSVVVREMFQNARESVVVIGYAVHQGQRVFQTLADRMAELRTLEVRMYLDIQRDSGDTSADSELTHRFKERFRKFQWPARSPLPQVFYYPKSLEPEQRERGALHAKGIVVDACQVFVSSANFTEAAQQRNIEVGVLLRSPTMADRLLRFLDTLVESAQLRRVL
jgi:phosphatidylserine/phosphatidylglycerophosphate/cardiolipin synthase-like enzyme